MLLAGLSRGISPPPMHTAQAMLYTLVAVRHIVVTAWHVMPVMDTDVKHKVKVRIYFKANCSLQLLLSIIGACWQIQIMAARLPGSYHESCHCNKDGLPSACILQRHDS